MRHPIRTALVGCLILWVVVQYVALWTQLESLRLDFDRSQPQWVDAYKPVPT